MDQAETGTAEVDTGGQASYQETPYRDQSWELVGEFTGEEVFLPMELEVVPGQGMVVDPMFGNYGGVGEADTVVRWHLPEDQAHQVLSQKQGQHEPEIPKISLTEEELALIRQQAFEDGRNAATQEIVEKQNERFGAVEKRLTSVLNDLIQQTRHYLANVEKAAVELALNISKRVIDQAVEVNPEYIVQIVSDGLHKAGGAVIRKVRVSPEDMEFIEIVGIAKRMKEWDDTWFFEPDESIRSGCVVETSAGEVDFQLDKAWERIKDQVVKVI